MTAWSFDMAKAPRGKVRLVPSGQGNGTRKVPERVDIIAASACGIVTLTRWLDEQRRWDMFTREAPPIAWMPVTGMSTEVVDGKERQVLPKHPTAGESWFGAFLRERRAA